jgi:nitroreductase
MEVFEAVRTVLAVREYAERPVPEDVLRKVVDAGHQSASSMNLQPWHYVVVRERETLQSIGRLARTGPYTASASFAVCVAVEKDSRFGVSDASRAIQNMVLTAWAEGVGSNWVGFGGLDEVAKLLGVPDNYDLLAVVPFGYPARRLGRGRRTRKPVGEVVSAERFGVSFS